MQPSVQALGRKTENSTVIAHISDLHISGATSFKNSIFQALLTDIKDRNVDVIVVTGDLVDSSLRDRVSDGEAQTQFTKAEDYLSLLCVAAAVKPDAGLVVVPGNHDFRTKGFLGFQKCQFDRFYEKFGKFTGPRLYPELKVCIFTFNSNGEDHALNFGTGVVDERELVAFSDAVRALRENHKEAWPTCTRIALVHHHPMPIPGAEFRQDALIDHEWFIVFKNAGLFLAEMIKAGVDIVLHGHEHYAAHSWASFPDANKEVRQLAVVAAGSAGTDQPRAPSYNIITIHDSGETLLDRRIRDQNTTYRTAEVVTLTSYVDARRARAIRLARKLGVLVTNRKFTRSIRILDRSGDCECRNSYEDVRAVSDQPVSELPLLETSAVGRNAFVGFKTTPPQTISIRWPDETSATAKKTGVTCFIPPIGPQPISYVRTARILNAFCFSEAERLDTTDQKEREEWARTRVTQLVETLVVFVAFPEGRMALDVKVIVRDHEGNVDERERQHVQPHLTISESERLVILTVEHPVPGYTYEIRWALPPSETEALQLTPGQVGYAHEFNRVLLALREEVGKPDADRTGYRALMGFRAMLVSSRVLQRLSEDTTLNFSLFAYDRERHGLMCACSTTNNNPESPLWEWVIKPGQTVNGRACRRREPLLWYRVGGATGDHDVIYEDFSTESRSGRPPHTAILAVPLTYPFGNGSIVGVVSIASRSATTALLDLAHDNELLVAVVEQAIAWTSATLVPALGLGPPPRVYAGSTQLDIKGLTNKL